MISNSAGKRKCRSRACGFGTIVLVLVGVQPLASLRSNAAEPRSAEIYTLNVGDKVAVMVFGQRDLSGEFTVDQSGAIRLPLIGDVAAEDLTPNELEAQVVRALKRGYVKSPEVSVRISEFSPIQVVGQVHQSGVFPYRQGISVLGAIAQAGGIGVPESRQGALMAEAMQSDERVRLLEISRVGLLAKQARLIAQQNGADQITFPDLSATLADTDRLAQIIQGERREFQTNREAHQQQIGALEKQIPRLQSAIDALEEQKALEQKQRQLNQELIADYTALMKNGLTRKPAYIEVMREAARIDAQTSRLESEKLRAQAALGEVESRIVELRNEYRRRTNADRLETDRLLNEISVTLPAALRARTFRGQLLGMLNAVEGRQPVVQIIRRKAGKSENQAAALDAVLRPGDIVQVGSLYPPTLNMPAMPIPGMQSDLSTQNQSPSPANTKTTFQKAETTGMTGSR